MVEGDRLLFVRTIHAVDVEAVADAFLIDGEHGFEHREDALGGVVGRVVVDFDVGCQLSTLRIIGGELGVEVGGEAHQDGIQVLVFQLVDVLLGEGAGEDGDVHAVGTVEHRGDALGHILHAHIDFVVCPFLYHALDACTHEAVDEVDEQSRHDDGGEYQLAVAKEACEFFLDDCQGVACSPLRYRNVH